MQPNTWAMLCHLGGLTGYAANGLGSVVVPLVLWIVKKDEMPEVNYHGKEAVNFNLSILIYGIGLGIATFILSVLTLGIAMFLLIPLFPALVIFHVVCTIIAAIKASNHEAYRYPLCIRFIK
jgi:uncharacterized Tic20 family protein